MTPNFLVQRCLPKRNNPVGLRTGAVFGYLLQVNKSRSLDDYAMIRRHIERRA